jgi:hypothetical protein
MALGQAIGPLTMNRSRMGRRTRRRSWSLTREMVRIYFSPEHKEEGLMLGSSSLVTYYQPAAAWCGLEPCGAADLHPGA